jgi:DNA-binding MarR family transcriptional regulator
MNEEDSFPFTNETDRLWVLLSQTRSALFKARHKRVKRFVHFNVAASLLHIWHYDGQVTMADLAKRLFLEAHSTSEIVKRLETKGFVRKTKDSGKGNIVKLWITEKGRQFCREVSQPDFVREVISSLTKDQQEQLWSLLNILYNKALQELDMEDMKEETALYRDE